MQLIKFAGFPLNEPERDFHLWKSIPSSRRKSFDWLVSLWASKSVLTLNNHINKTSPRWSVPNLGLQVFQQCSIPCCNWVHPPCCLLSSSLSIFLRTMDFSKGARPSCQSIDWLCPIRLVWTLRNHIAGTSPWGSVLNLVLQAFQPCTHPCHTWVHPGYFWLSSSSLSQDFHLLWGLYNLTG